MKFVFALLCLPATAFGQSGGLIVFTPVSNPAPDAILGRQCVYWPPLLQPKSSARALSVATGVDWIGWQEDYALLRDTKGDHLPNVDAWVSRGHFKATDLRPGYSGWQIASPSSNLNPNLLLMGVQPNGDVPVARHTDDKHNWLAFENDRDRAFAMAQKFGGRAAVVEFPVSDRIRLTRYWLFGQFPSGLPRSALVKTPGLLFARDLKRLLATPNDLKWSKPSRNSPQEEVSAKPTEGESWATPATLRQAYFQQDLPILITVGVGWLLLFAYGCVLLGREAKSFAYVLLCRLYLAGTAGLILFGFARAASNPLPSVTALGLSGVLVLCGELIRYLIGRRSINMHPLSGYAAACLPLFLSSGQEFTPWTELYGPTQQTGQWVLVGFASVVGMLVVHGWRRVRPGESNFILWFLRWPLLVISALYTITRLFQYGTYVAPPGMVANLAQVPAANFVEVFMRLCSPFNMILASSVGVVALFQTKFLLHQLRALDRLRPTYNGMLWTTLALSMLGFVHPGFFTTAGVFGGAAILIALHDGVADL